MTPDAKLFELIGIVRGYAGDINGAIDTLTTGLEAYPNDARLYRHRGHRYLNLAKLTQAHDDFLKARALLPAFLGYYEAGRSRAFSDLESLVLHGQSPQPLQDIAPLAAQGEYFASLAFKVHYHLGLTQHFLGNDKEALSSLEEALKEAENVDLKVATINWLAVLYKSTNQDAQLQTILAMVDFNQTAQVNAAYQDLLRIYKGVGDAASLLRAAESDPRVLATVGYGLAIWLKNTGSEAEGNGLLRDIVARGDKHAFGTVAASAYLARAQA